MEKNLDKLYLKIVTESIDKIIKNNIDIQELAFNLRIPKQELIKSFQERNKDFSIYLKMSDILEDWSGDN